MEVKGVHQLFNNLYSSKYFLLSSAGEIHTGVERLEGDFKDDIIFISVNKHEYLPQSTNFTGSELV